MGAARLGADCDATPWDPTPDVSLGEEVERCVSPLGVCLAGVGSAGALTVGVGMFGVEMEGVEIVGVEMAGVVILGVVTTGAVTEGTVTAGTLTVGTETVGTLTVGTLIVGPDATADAVPSSSAPQPMRTAIAYRRTGSRTGHRSPPDPSATDDLDIASRLRTVS